MLRRRSSPGPAACRTQHGPLPQLCPDLEDLSCAFRAAEDGGRVPGSHLCCHRAGFTVGDSPQRISSGKGGKVSGRSCPTGQHCRLGQEQHHGHHHHDHQCQARGQDSSGTPFTGILLQPGPRLVHPAPHGSPPAPARSPIRQWNIGQASTGHVPSSRSAATPARSTSTSSTAGCSAVAVSLRVEARAVRVHGIEEPKGPPTRSVTVMLNQPPSAAIEADAVPPARVRTVLSTAAGSSPLARARAPARAPSSIRNCVTPAAAPARSMTSRATTAGRTTANSAVTAPRESSAFLPPDITAVGIPRLPRPMRSFPPLNGSHALVTAAPGLYGSVSAGNRGPRHCGG